MSWLESLTPKHRRGNTKRSRRKTAVPGTWNSDPAKYAKRSKRNPGEGLMPTDYVFKDCRTDTSDIPIYVREQRFVRGSKEEEWKPASEPKRTIISLGIYRKWMSPDEISKLEEAGNYVRIMRNEDGSVMRRELMYGNQLVKIVTDFRTNQSPDLRSFSPKC